MNNHTDLLNYIAKKIGAESYLEIGVSNGRNFELVDCKNKIGVDPDINSKANFLLTSDDFFQRNSKTFDLIFIDGLHEAEQAKRDIINAWDSLKDGGVIVIHDCNPSKEEITHYPRDSKEWCGNVYKTVCELSLQGYGGFECPPKFTINMDYGCCVLRKKENEIRWNNVAIDWNLFAELRESLLYLISVEEGQKIIDSWI